jgi:acyl-CoA synthetase (AMP-forming)/AMP-acid ligase II
MKITGAPIIEGYGLSETSPTLTCNPADSSEYSGSIGIPVPSTYISPSATTTATKCRSASPARSAFEGPAGDGRLLAAAGGDRAR